VNGRAAALALALLASSPAPLAAQRVTFEALGDLEGWETDSASRLLSRNNGEAAWLTRVHTWLTWRASHALEFAALATGDAGTALNETDTAGHVEFYGSIELLAARYRPTRAIGFEAGKILMPLGTFGARHFSDVNPLIGQPDLYPPQYPWGAVASGAAGAFDWRAGVMSLPAVNTNYTPVPENRLRPVAGAGVSLGPAFHAGVSGTYGPYLGSRYTPQVPSGTEWTDYAQTIVAGDARVSAGYVEVRAEIAWSKYEVPTVAEPVEGVGWYGEARVTLSPRFFVAARAEQFRYPFILPINQSFWVGNTTTERNAEIGGGYRWTPDLLLKLSVRKDHWPEPHPPGVQLLDGYAVAAQLSWHVRPGEVIGRR
jgi:hypothetical protein